MTAKDYFICVSDEVKCDFCDKYKKALVFGEDHEMPAAICADCVEEMREALG